MWRPSVRDLECIIAVGEELHFGRAAKRLAMSQPALSQRIRRLEDSMEVALFERDHRVVRLTRSGAELMRHARAIVAQVDGAVVATRRAVAGGELKLVLGHRDYVSLPWMPAVIRRLADGEPPVHVEHHDLSALEVERGLLNRTIDVGLMANDVAADDLVARPLHRGHWVLVVPDGHALARDERVPVERLAGERLILFSRSMNTSVYDGLIDHMRDAGFEAQVVYQTSQAAHGPELVLSGVGCFLVMSYVLSDWPNGCRLLAIDGLPGVRLSFAWHVDNRTTALSRFREALDAEVPRRGFGDGPVGGDRKDRERR